MTQARAAGKTDVGRVRTHNEDAYLVRGELGLFAVADGLGGHNAGEVASQMALQAIESFVARAVEREDITWPFQPSPNLTTAENTLMAALKLANAVVWGEAQRSGERQGMATTIVALFLNNDSATIAHVGDSRLYRVRGGQIEQLTEDHSLVRQQFNAGTITAEQMAHHPMRNVITRAAGSREEVEVDVRSVPLEAGDVFVLCSDGLSGEITDAEIGGVVTDLAGDPEQAAQDLVERAVAAGGHDNTTVVVVATGA